jgi:hypothetical protein
MANALLWWRHLTGGVAVFTRDGAVIAAVRGVAEERPRRTVAASR